MPKMKTHSGAKKRLRVTGSGKVKRGHTFRVHKAEPKTAKRKRQLRRTAYVSPQDAGRIKRLLPYG